MLARDLAFPLKIDEAVALIAGTHVVKSMTNETSPHHKNIQ